jgi:histidinol phosphatase-like enzyme
MDYIAMDRDGCLVGNLGDYKNNSPSQYKTPELLIIPETIANLKGENLFIISNQAGIEAGYTSLGLVIEQCRWLHNVLKQNEINVLGTIFCPSYLGSHAIRVDSSHWGHVSRESQISVSYRKPGKGMGLTIEILMMEPPKYYVGDLSGKPGYAPGCKEPDSDRKFAENLGWNYLDIQDFLKQ